ncbi:hypothetical protein GCM10010341_82590 [Streptomyces noursei]|nr:hypothetical protein GCM10010341_82590 [Streptomyces noursei]
MSAEPTEAKPTARIARNTGIRTRDGETDAIPCNAMKGAVPEGLRSERGHQVVEAGERGADQQDRRGCTPPRRQGKRRPERYDIPPPVPGLSAAAVHEQQGRHLGGGGDDRECDLRPRRTRQAAERRRDGYG